MESRHNFLKHIGNSKDLDKVQNAQDIEKHFPVQCTQNNLLQAHKALRKAQHEEQAHGHNAHAHRSVHITKNNQHKGQNHRGQTKPQVLGVLRLLQFIFLKTGQAICFNRCDQNQPTGHKGQNGEPAQMHNKIAIGYASNITSHDHTRNNGTGKFKNMAEPKIDSCTMLLGKGQLLAGLLHNRC